MGEFMKRIYLDQWVWVRLAQAEAAHPRGDSWRDTLLLAEEAVKKGYASFPLSSVHYIETSHKRNHEKRWRLAGTMARLSQFHTIAQGRVLLPPEIDRALREMFGRPEYTRSAQVFGIGLAHALDWERANYRVPAEFGLSSAQTSIIEKQVQPMMEWALLAGPSRELEERLGDYDRDAHRAVPREFAEAQEEHREKLLEGDWHKGDKGRRVAMANAFSNFKEPLEEAMARAGLHWGHIYNTGATGMSELIGRIPIADVDTQLQRFRHEASDKQWEPNDLDDLDFLTRAIVYCDAVVTEKHWVSLAKRAGLEDKYGTQIMSQPDELTVFLATAGS
jgi:hypothetical protein